MRSIAALLACLALTACASPEPPPRPWKGLVTCWMGEKGIEAQRRDVLVDLDPYGQASVVWIGNCDHVDVYLIAPDPQAEPQREPL